MKPVSYGGALETSKLTESERREALSLEKEQDRVWRAFWCRVYKRQGLSNVDIAKKMNLSESTIRTTLNKER